MPYLPWLAPDKNQRKTNDFLYVESIDLIFASHCLKILYIIKVMLSKICCPEQIQYKFYEVSKLSESTNTNMI